MNIEKTECDRLGYEYKSLLEQVVYALHHIPFTKDFINEEGLKKLDDLCLKLSTGDCEIIEFKRTLCKYNFSDILEEKDNEIDRLINLNKQLVEECQRLDDEETRLNNIINYICQVFENGSFEDGCDCIEIYDYLKQLKEEK